MFGGVCLNESCDYCPRDLFPQNRVDAVSDSNGEWFLTPGINVGDTNECHSLTCAVSKGTGGVYL